MLTLSVCVVREGGIPTPGKTFKHTKTFHSNQNLCVPVCETLSAMSPKNVPRTGSEVQENASLAVSSNIQV